MPDPTPPLTPAQLDELRGELERELRRLERTMHATGEAAKPVELDQTTVGRLSRMDAMQNQHMAAELHERERARHTGLVLALERMDHGTYGVCDRCGAVIPYGRLLVIPEARTCASCGGA